MHPALSQHKVTVLLVDDQPLIGEAVRRMVAGEPDIDFQYCKEPTKAIQTAADVRATVILQDLVMPDIDGLDLVTQYRQADHTRDVPIIVLSTREEPVTKAEAFARGASDYIVKLPDRLELLARIRHHSRGYINQLQRDEAFNALVESQKKLASDVAEAARYVQSLLPEKWNQGPVRADWRFIPSAALGGDTFGYHKLDDRHVSLYLIDVVGHGVGPALLSVSVLNALRSQSLPNADFLDPGQVITALNRTFQMTQQADKYFTAWYGVLDLQDRVIHYCGGGHPPALLITNGTPTQLEAVGPMIGAFEDLDFHTLSQPVPPDTTLYLYSDGCFEVVQPDGSMWPFDTFVELMAQPPNPGESAMDRLITHIRTMQGRDSFEDDFSIAELKL